jgi:hypothetical protein
LDDPLSSELLKFFRCPSSIFELERGIWQYIRFSSEEAKPQHTALLIEIVKLVKLNIR